MGLSRIFDISRRSLATYQKAMDITSHNVANASNPNYSRQRISFVTESPEVTANFIWGSGIKIDDVERVRSQLVDSQLRNSYASFHGNEQESILLSQVEQVFSEPSDLGISNMLTEFFNAWNELAVSPNSMALRYNVIQNSQQLSDRFKIVYDNLSAIRYDALRSFTEKTNQVNTMLQQIQQLNVQIVDSGAAGISANDIMDERDTILDELSKIANINVIYNNNNAANVSIGGVQALDTTGFVEFEAREVNGKLTLSTKESNITVTINGGELAGLSTVYSRRIPEYLESLDLLASTLLNEVNTLHNAGYTLEEPPQTGVPFFESYGNGDLVINPAILEDAVKIAVSGDGNQGDGKIAADISNLSNQSLLNNITLNENYTRMVAKLGNARQTADKITESTEMVIQQLKEQKGSVSGVSIDEEMTNIIRFQRSYDASARLIAIADEMLETLINMV